MKKNIYYFSEKKLKYAEIKNFYLKFISIVAFFSLLIGFLLFAGYEIISELIVSKETKIILSADNDLMKKKFFEMAEKIKVLNSDIEYLQSTNNDLRITVNLDPLTNEDRNLGIGGSVFKK